MICFQHMDSLRSWRYCVGARLKFWRRSRVPKKGSRDEAVFLAASPLVTAPPSNLTRLYCNGSAAKSLSTITKYRQLRRLVHGRSFSLPISDQRYVNHFKIPVSSLQEFYMINVLRMWQTLTFVLGLVSSATFGLTERK